MFMNKHDFVDWVLSEMKKTGLRQAELSRIGMIDSGYVSHVLNREQKPGDAFCHAVAIALNIREQEVRYKAGLTKEKPIDYDAPGLRELCDEALSLTPDQRYHVVNLMRMLKDGSLSVSVYNAETDPNE
jgi:transcriptional regulator with XRE-family HTH domain